MVRQDVWQRWLDLPPVISPPFHAAALRSMLGIWIDAGTADDYYLDVGAQAFLAAIEKAGVRPEVIRFELFDGTHSAIDYRYPMSLAWLCERIAG